MQRPGEPVLVAGPAKTPATLEDVKGQARITHDLEDEDLLRRLKAATTWAEGYLKRKLITQTWEISFNAFPARALRLPFPPLAWDPTVEEDAEDANNFVKYLDGPGVLQTVDPADYLVRENRTPGELVPAYGKCWPSTRCIEDAVTVRFTCGYGLEADDVPQAAREAIAVLAATRQSFREDAVVGTIVTAAPFGVRALLSSVPRVTRL